MVDKIIQGLSLLPQVEAIALGGSRAEKNYDKKSDYDFYVYCSEEVGASVRRKLLEPYCRVMEIGNSYWECEDDCILSDGTEIEILYRSLGDFCAALADTVERYQPSNAYTTCLWYNLLKCKILYDPAGRLAAAKKRFDVPYPIQLRQNIIERGRNLLYKAMPAYQKQILKASRRGDLVAVNHRTAAFLESYFDVLLAINELPHPGEKRLVSYCKANCRNLPPHFEEQINKLFLTMYGETAALEQLLREMCAELEAIL